MALGRYPISVDLLTASDPDDTTLFAAQGEGEIVYLQWLDIHVTTVEASTSIQIEDGVGGDVVALVLSTVLGTTQFRWAHYKDDDGLPLTKETLLNATTIGGQALDGRVTGEVVVRGGL